MQSTSKELVILPDGHGPRTALFILCLTAVLGFLFWETGVAGSGAVAAFAFMVGIAFCGLISFETRISAEKQEVVRLWHLGRLIPLWSRTYSFDCLRGVRQLYFPEGEYDVWRVGVVTASGKFLMVTYFSSRLLSEPETEAQHFQDYLAKILCVPILDQEQEA